MNSAVIVMNCHSNDTKSKEETIFLRIISLEIFILLDFSNENMKLFIQQIEIFQYDICHFISLKTFFFQIFRILKMKNMMKMLINIQNEDTFSRVGEFQILINAMS